MIQIDNRLQSNGRTWSHAWMPSDVQIDGILYKCSFCAQKFTTSSFPRQLPPQSCLLHHPYLSITPVIPRDPRIRHDSSHQALCRTSCTAAMFLGPRRGFPRHLHSISKDVCLRAGHFTAADGRDNGCRKCAAEKQPARALWRKNGGYLEAPACI